MGLDTQEMTMTKRGLFLKVAERLKMLMTGTRLFLRGVVEKSLKARLCLAACVQTVSTCLIVVWGWWSTAIYGIDCSGGVGPNHYLPH